MNTCDEPRGFARSIGVVACLDAVLSDPNKAGSDRPCNFVGTNTGSFTTVGAPRTFLGSSLLEF